MSENSSVTKGLTIFECLFKDDFKGMSLREISNDTGIPSTTAWRMLKTLESQGWVVEMPVLGSKQGHWRVSTKLAEISQAYKRYSLERVNSIKKEYTRVTGEEMS
jgi:DNA-binding IclR family transcriptional regulator